MAGAVGAGLSFVCSAVAQPEQWLEYHTGPEPRGYRWLELSTNPPAGVALPKLQPAAWFGCWTNGMEAGQGRWFCFDRSRRSGPAERLFFDANGNGRLDDEAPINPARRDQVSTTFAPVKVVFKGEDGPVSYHLLLRHYNYGQNIVRLLAGAAGWYEGTVALAGKKHRIRLVDNTVNGAFNDMSTDPDSADLIVFGDDESRSRHVGRYLEVDGQLLSLEVARDGAFIKVKPAEGVAFGAVRAPETISEFVALGENGHFIRKPNKGEFKLPAGHYRVLGWEIERKDKDRKAWTLRGSGFGPAADFEVGPDKAAVVGVGEPVYAALEAVESKTAVEFDLKFIGPLGEAVDMLCGGEQPRAPQVRLAGGAFSVTRNFEYG